MDAVEIGNILRNKRVEQDMSVDDVAERLNVTAQTVNYIENGEHEKLSGEVFVRGYIRYYARVLGISASGLLGTEEEQPMEIKVEDDMDYGHDERILKLTRTWGTVAIIFILMLVIYAWWAENEEMLMDAGMSEDTSEVLEEAPAIPDTEAHDGVGDLIENAEDAENMEDMQGAVDSTDSQGVMPGDVTNPDWSGDETDTESSYPSGGYSSPFDEDSDEEPEATATGDAESTPGAEDEEAFGDSDEMTGEARDAVRDVVDEPAVPGESRDNLPDNLTSVELETSEYESWVQVIDADGVTLEETLLSPFSRISIYGKAPFDFKIGYVQGVILRIDGEIYDFSQYEDRGLAFFRAPGRPALSPVP